MSLSRVLPSIIIGKLDFCCLCFEGVCQGVVYIHDDIDLDLQGSVTMESIISTVFGDHVLDSIVAFGIFCSRCTINALNSYKFIKTCKDNDNRLSLALNSITESVNITLPDTDSYKTLCVSIDINNYTSKQLYFDTYLENATDVLKKIKETNRKLIKTKTYINKDTLNEIHKPKAKKTNSYDKTAVKYAKTYSRTVARKNKRRIIHLTFDIPTIPTEHLVADPDTGLQCRECLKNFTTKRTLRDHFFRRHYPRNVKCQKCSRSFISEEMLKQHNDIAHDGVCKECGKYFSNIRMLLRHEQNHSFEITCSKCGRLYHSMEAFKKHKVDDVCSQKMKKSVEQAIYECDHCHKRYNYKFYLAKHIMHEHGNVEGFRCEYCNKNFYSKSRLKTHLVKHTKKKSYMCSICEKYFVTRESLLYHVRLHTGETPYKCDYCDQAFINASRRLDHMRAKHLPPGFECQICLAKFKTMISFKRHKKRH